MRVLVIDDDKTFRVVAAAALTAEGHEVKSARTGGEGLELARTGQPDVVVLDRNLPDADGLEVLARLLAPGHDDPPLVIMVTAYGEIENAVAAVKGGAFDYLTKPVALPALVVAVGKAASARRLRRRARGHSDASRRRLERTFCPGASAAMREVVALAEKVARSPDTTVLVTGESGTGKELVSQRVHLATPERGEAPFVELNCAAVPETLLEAELFGHEKVRFVAATHRDLDAAVAQGTFRLDLFHRLDVFRIHVPPLRERRDDILPLARFFLEELAARAGKAIRALAPDTERRLLAYAFPGNVRELHNVIERAVILESGPELSPESLLLRPSAAPSPQSEPAPLTPERPPPTLAEVERAYVAELLARAGGNKSQVARWMGVSYPTVAKKIADYGLAPPTSDDEGAGG